MEYKVITDLAYTYIGLVTTMTKHYVSEGVPLIFNSSIKKEGIDVSKPVFLDIEFAEKNKNRKHKKNDVVTVHTGDIGVSAVISDDLDGSLGFATIVTRINDHDVLLPEYLCVFLNYGGGKEQLYKYSRDARNNLNLADYNRLIVPLPSINKQYEIIELEKKLKKIIDYRKQQLQQLDDLVKARFVEMFGDPIDNPLGLQVKTLKELSALITNGNTPKGGSENYVDNGILFLRSQNVWRNRIELDDVAYIDEATHRSLKRSSLKHKDILITKTGRINTENSSLGRAALYLGADDSANINGHVYLVRLNDSVVPEYVVTILTSEAYRKYIRKVCVGGIDKRQINLDQVENFPIILPPIEQQEQFVAFLEQTDKSKVVVQKALDEAQTLFDSLMQEYFGLK